MELKDTIPLMTSADYRERFKAEYWQLKIRVDKLSTILQHWLTWRYDEKRNTPCPLLEDQYRIMREYLSTLKLRANIEGINLEE